MEYRKQMWHKDKWNTWTEYVQLTNDETHTRKYYIDGEYVGTANIQKQENISWEDSPILIGNI